VNNPTVNFTEVREDIIINAADQYRIDRQDR